MNLNKVVLLIVISMVLLMAAAPALANQECFSSQAGTSLTVTLTADGIWEQRTVYGLSLIHIFHIMHPASFSFKPDRFLGLFLGTYKNYVAAPRGDIAHKVVGHIHQLDCFLQINNVDTVAFGEDIVCLLYTSRCV